MGGLQSEEGSSDYIAEPGASTPHQSNRMKTTRTTKTALLAVVCIALLGWLATCTSVPPKARAHRINTQHNIVTKPILVPASLTAAQSAQGKK